MATGHERLGMVAQMVMEDLDRLATEDSEIREVMVIVEVFRPLTEQEKMMARAQGNTVPEEQMGASDLAMRCTDPRRFVQYGLLAHMAEKIRKDLP